MYKVFFHHATRFVGCIGILIMLSACETTPAYNHGDFLAAKADLASGRFEKAAQTCSDLLKEPASWSSRTPSRDDLFKCAIQSLSQLKDREATIRSLASDWLTEKEAVARNGVEEPFLLLNPADTLTADSKADPKLIQEVGARTLNMLKSVPSIEKHVWSGYRGSLFEFRMDRIADAVAASGAPDTAFGMRLESLRFQIRNKATLDRLAQQADRLTTSKPSKMGLEFVGDIPTVGNLQYMLLGDQLRREAQAWSLDDQPLEDDFRNRRFNIEMALGDTAENRRAARAIQERLQRAASSYRANRAPRLAALREAELDIFRKGIAQAEQKRQKDDADKLAMERASKEAEANRAAAAQRAAAERQRQSSEPSLAVDLAKIIAGAANADAQMRAAHQQRMADIERRNNEAQQARQREHDLAQAQAQARSASAGANVSAASSGSSNATNTPPTGGIYSAPASSITAGKNPSSGNTSTAKYTTRDVTSCVQVVTKGFGSCNSRRCLYNNCPFKISVRSKGGGFNTWGTEDLAAGQVRTFSASIFDDGSPMTYKACAWDPNASYGPYFDPCRY